ncbi:hypothetical protein T4E_5986 [Trichinella pseudospiralis]|uniref:Uncharacterized protein n=1 Tax=Trichinella pseudospiralis TaxID=6337 RepID=A0A0V0XLB2_TRIPS|nr:hypothetical protein T4E_4436 [Trichinella pseudospiralis]KRX88652.1 hypothetical protein T4E_5986 [Trichinella pseudospiralis]
MFRSVTVDKTQVPGVVERVDIDPLGSVGLSKGSTEA